MRFFSSISTELSADPERCLFEAVHDLPASGDPADDGYPHRTTSTSTTAGRNRRQVTRLTEQYLDDEETPVVGGSAGDDLQYADPRLPERPRRDGRRRPHAHRRRGRAPVTVNHGDEPISEAMTVTRQREHCVRLVGDLPSQPGEVTTATTRWSVRYRCRRAGGWSEDLVTLLGRYELGIESEPN